MHMVNGAVRREAINIANGEELAESVNEKVAMYGLLGRVFDAYDLVNLFEGRPKPTNFFELNIQIAQSLIEIADSSYYSLSEEDQRKVESLFARKYPQASFDLFGRRSPYAPFPLERMRLGAAAAAEREVLTLRTIAKKVSQGHPVT